MPCSGQSRGYTRPISSRNDVLHNKNEHHERTRPKKMNGEPIVLLFFYLGKLSAFHISGRSGNVYIA